MCGGFEWWRMWDGRLVERPLRVMPKRIVGWCGHSIVGPELGLGHCSQSRHRQSNGLLPPPDLHVHLLPSCCGFVLASFLTQCCGFTGGCLILHLLLLVSKLGDCHSFGSIIGALIFVFATFWRRHGMIPIVGRG